MCVCGGEYESSLSLSGCCLITLFCCLRDAGAELAACTADMQVPAVLSELAVAIELVVRLLPPLYIPGSLPLPIGAVGRGVIQAQASRTPALCADCLAREALGIDAGVDFCSLLTRVPRGFLPEILIIYDP